MATTQDNVELKYEESPRYEGAVTTTPYQISTIARYFPLQSFAWNPAPQMLDRGDEIRGIEGAPPQLIDGYQPGGTMATRAYVNDLIFLLGLAGFKGVHTAGDGVITDPDGSTIPANAHRWVFLKRGGVTPRTGQFTSCYADEAIWLKGQGVGISRLSLDVAGAVSADLTGLVFARLGSDPNITPSLDSFAIPNLRQGDFTMQSWLASAGTADDFSFEIANTLNPYRGLNASFFPHDLLFGDDRVRVTGARPARTLAAADIDALVAGTTFAAKGRWVSPKVIGATAYKYSMWVDMPACQYVGGNADELKNARRFGGSYNWFAAWDEIAGYDVKFTLVGSIASITSIASGE